MKPIEAEMHPISFARMQQKEHNPIDNAIDIQRGVAVSKVTGGISCDTAVGVIHVVFWDTFHDKKKVATYNSDLHLCGVLELGDDQ